jgi:nitrate/TMAO reductase-like tetraheme cytochrome c subunit
VLDTPSRPKQKASGLRRLLNLKVIVAVVALGLLFTAGGFTFAATQESHDSFCASCHTQPESTFYQRSQGSSPVDLASVHTTYKTRCIDCHSGSGVIGRMGAEMLGARNAVLFYTGTASQPAKLTQPIGDDNCLKCHQIVTAGRGRNNHFHAFLARWQAADPQAGGCVSCHGGHSTDSSADSQFTSEAQIQPVCDACHKVLRHGD